MSYDDGGYVLGIQTSMNAQIAANNARDEAGRANMAANHAIARNHQLEREQSELRQRMNQMEQEQNQAQRELMRSSLVQEAVTSIPFLRGELEQAYKSARWIRDLASKWLQGNPVSEKDRDTLRNYNDSTGASEGYWLALAIDSAISNSAGDVTRAARLYQKAKACAPVHFFFWCLGDALRTFDISRFTHELQQLTALIKFNDEVPRDVWKFFTAAGSGHLNKEMQSTMLTAVKTWYSQALKADPKGDASKQFFGNLKFNIFPVPEEEGHLFRSVANIGSEQANAAIRNVSEAWSELAPIESTLKTAPEIKPWSNKPETYQELGRIAMAKMASYTLQDEAVQKAMLASYLAAVATKGDFKAASAAEERSLTESLGEWIPTSVVIAELHLLELREEILRMMRPQIKQTVENIDSSTFGALPPLYGKEGTSTQRQMAIATQRLKAEMDKHGGYNQQERIRLERKKRKDKIRLNVSIFLGFVFGCFLGGLGERYQFNVPFNFVALYFDLHNRELIFWSGSVSYAFIFAAIACVKNFRDTGKKTPKPEVKLDDEKMRIAKQEDDNYAKICQMATEATQLKKKLLLSLR